ncbi:uncharacterized protein MELLADRAFT_113351 [Melampsora larici-populina 98AG31]|uniref:Alpha-type protein kinase domain-containing protein n=1 Tax=Melampsora larici-populina (strain 98AG31 / pathotype 3-4-7) TaxID=747676 RepID=F4S9L0_MELLP|nr:uncharacterized protein MELLADRAFT_113351 [Melampsora larici-populina 98AG31]EGF98657.1 hypothetical protein MELLADRAFT_113351 [Melampsora larici-populina 98AG31]
MEKLAIGCDRMALIALTDIAASQYANLTSVTTAASSVSQIDARGLSTSTVDQLAGISVVHKTEDGEGDVLQHSVPPDDKKTEVDTSQIDQLPSKKTDQTDTTPTVGSANVTPPRAPLRLMSSGFESVPHRGMPGWFHDAMRYSKPFDDENTLRAAFMYKYRRHIYVQPHIYVPENLDGYSRYLVVYSIGKDIDLYGTRDSNEWIAKEYKCERDGFESTVTARYHTAWCDDSKSNSRSHALAFVQANRYVANLLTDYQDSLMNRWMTHRHPGEEECNKSPYHASTTFYVNNLFIFQAIGFLQSNDPGCQKTLVCAETIENAFIHFEYQHKCNIYCEKLDMERVNDN